ncbi:MULTISPECIES: Gfo/Idh/MocA family oxidoreductase [unclassified Streptomyces]|uniref:Gfo/Idh/MocA family protein n=1 Tax=unclassified Streptomyces TaxID=2593676 RepID=UPI000DBA9C6F|nr:MULTISPECIES: Gfo/Idh/MocA family oxidoreductase [unclassified Streptomyces]MYT69859.1 Gfo/Idh/MocA family oxidoreductase [Streptomyces sp. SID8367]RAJ88433.1 putative dehydrogenase [Streptomyces sp. PsTaAH-137]
MPSPAQPQPPIGVGIVGLSARRGWASHAHLPALRLLDGFEVRALSASSPESARQAAEKHGVARAYGSAAELAAADEVDLVVVTVKVPDHREIIRAALGAGKAVLSEWPLGTGPGEAEELASLAAARGLRTFTGLQARSAPLVRHLRDLIADGYVGEVLSTSVVASARGWGASVHEGGAYLLDRASGANMLTIPFGHTLDAVTAVLGDVEEISAVTATRRRTVPDDAGRIHRPDVADQLVLGGVLSSGAVASVHYRGGVSRGTNFLWEINGTDGDLVVTGDHGHLQMGEYTLAGARGADSALAPLTVPEHYFDPALAALRGTDAYNVGAAYAQIRRDVVDGTRVVPDFAHAARHHRVLNRIEHTAAH